MVSPNSSTTSTDKTLQYVQSRKSGSRVYVQGLIAVSVFIFSLIIVVIIYVPYISKTTEISKSRKAMESVVDSLQVKYDTINNYAASDLSGELVKARYYVPDEMRVAQLATFINANAVKYGLQVSRLGINEDQTEVKQADSQEQAKLLGSTKAEKKIYLGRVEGPFGFRGTRVNIFKFLDFLVTGGYATNFDQVTITSSSKEEEWSVSLVASYYYLEPLVKVEAARALLIVQKDSFKAITIAPTTAVPETSVTPSVSVSPTISPTVTVSVTPTFTR